MKQGKVTQLPEQDLRQGFTRGKTGFAQQPATTDEEKQDLGSDLSPTFEEVAGRKSKD